MEKQKCCCKERKDAEFKLVCEGGDLYYCGDTECKARIEKELQEDYERSIYQGRTFKQYEASSTALYYAFLILIGLMSGYFLYRLISLL